MAALVLQAVGRGRLLLDGIRSGDGVRWRVEDRVVDVERRHGALPAPGLPGERRRHLARNVLDLRLGGEVADSSLSKLAGMNVVETGSFISIDSPMPSRSSWKPHHGLR